MRLSGQGSDLSMVLLPLAFLCAFALVAYGGPWELMVALDDWLRTLGRSAANWVASMRA